jgi:amphiphysin
MIDANQLIDCAKSWRDSWVNLTSSQLGIATEYEGLYDPIEGSARASRPGFAASELQLHRTFKLREAYSDIKSELGEDLEAIESRVIQPMLDTRDCLAPLRKTIKKRENKRLDYENAQEKTAKLQRKPGKTIKEKATLEKLEGEEARCAEVRKTDVCLV